MPFGIVGPMGPGMRQIVGFGDRSTERGTFGGEFGAHRCNEWGVTFIASRPFSQITLDRPVQWAKRSAGTRIASNGLRAQAFHALAAGLDRMDCALEVHALLISEYDK